MEKEIKTKRKHTKDEDAAVRKTAKHHRRAAVPVASFFIIFALIGIAATVYTGIRATLLLLDNTQQKRDFERLILPVVMYDPMVFEDIENVVAYDPTAAGDDSIAQVDPIMPLQCSIWAALMNNGVQKYGYDEYGLLVVSRSDIELEAVKLFGPAVKLTHQTFENFDMSYQYSESDESYHMLISEDMLVYSPVVDNISKQEDKYLLRVGYIPPGISWLKVENDASAIRTTPFKWMIYELTRSSSGYYISAIREEKPLEGIQQSA